MSEVFFHHRGEKKETNIEHKTDNFINFLLVKEIRLINKCVIESRNDCLHISKKESPIIGVVLIKK